MMFSGSGDPSTRRAINLMFARPGAKAHRASFRVRVGSLDRLDDHRVIMLLGRSLEEDICPGIDEEANVEASGVCRAWRMRSL
jgi:hypothetical protein